MRGHRSRWEFRTKVSECACLLRSARIRALRISRRTFVVNLLLDTAESGILDSSVTTINCCLLALTQSTENGVRTVEQRVRDKNACSTEEDETSKRSSSRASGAAATKITAAVLQASLDSFKLFPRIHVGRCRGSR